jgi:hypothetical protein
MGVVLGLDTKVGANLRFKIVVMSTAKGCLCKCWLGPWFLLQEDGVHVAGGHCFSGKRVGLVLGPPIGILRVHSGLVPICWPSRRLVFGLGFGSSQLALVSILRDGYQFQWCMQAK